MSQSDDDRAVLKCIQSIGPYGDIYKTIADLKRRSLIIEDERQRRDAHNIWLSPRAKKMIEEVGA